MVMSKINTFMSNGTVNEDAESPALERGAWPVVARKRRGRSGDHIGAGTRHLAAASVSVSARGACARTCDAGWRTVGAGDVQNSSRRARAIACVFQAQRFAAERDCHRGYREAFDRNTSAGKTWLSALQSVLRFVWNLRSIACSPSSYNKSRATGCELRSSSRADLRGEQRRRP
jgi:hypothetical protein